MHTRRACLWSKVTREMRALGSLASIFILALLLAWLLSAGRALSFFQSPTSPLSPTEALPLMEVEPTASPAPTEVKPTVPPAPTEAAPTLTPAAPPAEMVTEPTLAPTKVVLMPAVQAARPTTAPPTELPSSRGAISLWPWALLGLFSLGAIAVGVFLLRREVPAKEEEG